MAIASGTCGTCSWVISDSGDLTVSPTTGTEGYLEYGFIEQPPWVEYLDRIVTATFSGNISSHTREIMSQDYTTGSFAFFHNKIRLTSATKLKSVSGLENLKGVKSLHSLFFGCESLTSVDFLNLNTTELEDIGCMFYGCKSLTSIDLSNFNTTKVFDVDDLFDDCDLLSEVKFGNDFDLSKAIEYAKSSYGEDARIYPRFYQGENLSNGIVVSNDDAFANLTASQRAGTWRRNIESSFDVKAERTSQGVSDDDGNDVTITTTWSTDATTTTRTLLIYKKLAASSSYPSTADKTVTLSGNSGIETTTISNIGDDAYDFRVEFYDGTNRYIAFPSVQSNIRLITVDENCQIEVYLDHNGSPSSKATSGSDKDLYNVIYDNGWLLELLN